MTAWADRYIRIPFVDGGRDHFGCDCWGLIRLVYRDQLQIELPSYGEIDAKNLVGIARKMKAGSEDGEQWIRVVGVPKAFDACLMTWFGKREIAHIGVMIDAKHVLHTEDRTGVSMSRIDHPHILSRVRMFCRHKALAGGLNE